MNNLVAEDIEPGSLKFTEYRMETLLDPDPAYTK